MKNTKGMSQVAEISEEKEALKQKRTLITTSNVPLHFESSSKPENED
jgi:hypothetical protein